MGRRKKLKQTSLGPRIPITLACSVSHISPRLALRSFLKFSKLATDALSMTYPTFGATPPPPDYLAHQVLGLESEVLDLRKKVRTMNRGLWIIGVIVGIAIVLPFVYGFTAGFLAAL